MKLIPVVAISTLGTHKTLPSTLVPVLLMFAVACGQPFGTSKDLSESEAPSTTAVISPNGTPANAAAYRQPQQWPRLQSFPSARASLSDGPVETPLVLEIPAIKVRASVLSVGLDEQGLMEAPMGAPDDPIWQEVFWFRGGALPGNPSTATIAGHVSGGRGPSIFADLHQLQNGDRLEVIDTRNDTRIQFEVVDKAIYKADEANDPAILKRVYGEGPVLGVGPRRSADGISRLTLITCAGELSGETYDRRLTVYTERVS